MQAEQKIDPRRMLIDEKEWFDHPQGASVVCPICKNPYVHLDGKTETKGFLGNCGALFIPMLCESGHSWELVIDQHKGKCFMTITKAAKISPIDEGDWK